LGLQIQDSSGREGFARMSMLPQRLELVHVAKPKSSWADMSDDQDDDDSTWESGSLQETPSVVSTPSGYQRSSDEGEKMTIKKLRNRPLSKVEAIASASAMQRSPRDTSSESSFTIASSTESSMGLAIEPGSMISLGSATHDEGRCKPCVFVNTHTGCQNGSLCEFCHLPHKRKTKARPCKGKRDRYRRLLLRVFDSVVKDSDEVDEAFDAQEMPPVPPRDQQTRVAREAASNNQLTPNHLMSL